APTSGGLRRRVLGAGRLSWAVLGLVGVLVLSYLVLSRLAVVTVPIVLAFFVAGALQPLARVLRRLRLPPSLAALLALLIGLAVVGGTIALIVPAVTGQVPALVASLERAVGQLQGLLGTLPGAPLDLRTALTGLAGPSGGGRITAALGTTASVLTGVVLVFVVAFFYLTEGRWLVRGLVGWLPAHRRPAVAEMAERVWDTVGRYIRGILLVALADAIGIGLGLYLLGVPLALPLAVVVYLGAFVPVVGAFVSGLLAVLVALASGGPGLALAALAVVLVVQQLEGNVLQPFIMGRVIRLPAFVILVAVAIGSAWLGVLGAFLAVPVAASIARILEYHTDEQIDTLPS
ncbi:MAG: AI-2E family transporter, partial [Actinomycetota bacterium]|nr:AI-2E family transporter [Actinomycetota bacterium]